MKPTNISTASGVSWRKNRLVLVSSAVTAAISSSRARSRQHPRSVPFVPDAWTWATPRCSAAPASAESPTPTDLPWVSPIFAKSDHPTCRIRPSSNGAHGPRRSNRPTCVDGIWDNRRWYFAYGHGPKTLGFDEFAADLRFVRNQSRRATRAYSTGGTSAIFRRPHTQNAGIPTFLKDGTQHWLKFIYQMIKARNVRRPSDS